MAAMVQPIRLVIFLQALLAQHGQATSEDISYLDYDLVAEGSRTCLSNAIAFSNRSNISFSAVGGPSSSPVHIWQFSWPVAHTLAEVIKIFLQEVMGFHAITYGNLGASNTAFTALGDCYNPADVGQPCRVQARGSRGHLAYEVWSNYDTSMLAKFVTENINDYTPTRVGYPGGIGYDGVEGMFVGAGSYDPAGEAPNYLFLQWYESYNNSWSSPQPYFADYTNLTAPSQACDTIGAFTLTGGLQDYIDATGHQIPTVTINGVGVAACVDGPSGNAGSWLPSKACRERSLTGCIPVITSGGWSAPDMMQWSFWWNIATIIGSFAWGDYTSIVNTRLVLCYWWLPDNTFSSRGLVTIQFPPEDKDAIAQGIVRTQKSATKIWKMMSNVLGTAEPLLEQFMNNFEISMGSMMDMAVTYNSADPWQTACDFLTTYPARWANWAPSRTNCVPGQGLTTDANGIPICQWCPDGQYSMDDPNGTSKICIACELGRAQASPGQTICDSCAVGSAAGTTGMSACDPCPLGTYTNLTGQSGCASCGYQKDTPAFWTTMANLQTPSGTRVSYITGATALSDCTCDTGTRYVSPHDQSQCVACISELSCAGMGQVQVLEGFAAYDPTGAGKVDRVFECNLDTRWCPGGDPGVCQEGRQGIQCGECKPNHTPGENGKCKLCGGADYAPFIIVVSLAVILLCLGYHMAAGKKDGQGKQSMSVMLVVTTGGQLIVLVQMTGVFSSLTVEWAEPFGTILAITKIVSSFNLDFINLSCVATFGPLGSYISRVSIIFIGIVTILIVFVIHTIVLRGGDFKKMGKKLIVALGALSMALFISVVSTITAPLQCFRHPSGEWTIRTYPTVLCSDGDGSDWVSMLIIAVVTSVLPISLMALVSWVVYSFPARMQKMDADFFAVTGFLFVCYRTESYWFCLAIWLRNLTVSLVPIVPSVVAQISIFNAMVIFMLIMVNKFQPWRAYIANYLDTAIYVMVIGINGLAIGFASPDTAILAPMCLALFIAALLALIGVAFYGAYKVLAPQKKKYEFFVSHHKAAAGAFARLLKMMIIEAKPCEVFIDSDNLVSLDLLFDTVGSDVEHIPMLCSAEFMKRPWCIGELTTACLRKVKVWPLYMADFKNPDQDFIDNYLNYVPDIKTLAENNITLESLQDGMRWFNTLPFINLPAYFSNETLDILLARILACDMSPLSGEGATVKTVSTAKSTVSMSAKVRNTAQIMVAADESQAEAMATARILCKLLQSYGRAEGVDNSAGLLPEILADTATDGEPLKLTTSTNMVVVVLTNGAIHQPYIINVLKLASEVDAALMPVVGDDGFRFPSDDFYERLRGVAAKSLGDEALGDKVVLGVKNMFKRIAPLFESNASITLLKAQSGELYKKIKVFYARPAESRKSDWKVQEEEAAPEAV